MASQPELAARLGLSSPANDDLSWLVARCSAALAGKPSPVKTWDAVKFYADLAVTAQTPDWAENADEAEPLIQNGWFREAAPFEAQVQTPEELSIGQEELLLVCSDEPAPRGWVMAAREADTSDSRLVPASYIVAADVAVVAATAFAGSSDGELSFNEGDEIIIRPGALPCQAWWLAKVGGRRGYVPRYLLDPSWRERGWLAVSVIWGRYAAWRDRRGAAENAVRDAEEDVLRGDQGTSGASSDDQSVAEALGVNLATDGDLVWIGTRALQCKPPYPHEKTAAQYRALAVLATDPPWPEDATGAPPLLPHGWYRAVAIAGFAPEQPTELAIAEGDMLLVSSDSAAPPGWLLAAPPSDPTALGLVPEAHLIADDVAVIARCDFHPISAGDLPFRAGDALLVRPGASASKSYWLARSGHGRGYVPRYMLDASWRPRGELAVALIWAGFRAHRTRRGGAEARAGRARDAASSPSIAERKAACEIGLSLSTHPDLVWIARRAMARKPPLPNSVTRGIYGSLVVSATHPPWPASAAGELLGKGKYTASALAPFAASDAREMSFTESERLVLQANVPSPDGWILAARAADGRQLGLVPRAFVRADEVTLVAPMDHTGIDDCDLTFCKGDILTLRPMAVEHSRAHWLARAAGRRCFVPRYLLDPTWRAQGQLAVRIIWAHYRAHRSRGGDSEVPEQGKVLPQPGTLPVGETRSHNGATTSDAVPAVVAECAAMLGIDVIADTDLLWIAQKAMHSPSASRSADPPVLGKQNHTTGGKPDEQTLHKYRALVALATDPSWRRDPASLGPLMRHGLYRATAAAAFHAQDARELSVAAGEALLVSGDEPTAQGWVATARAADPEVRGLVPQSFVQPDDVNVIASCGFDGVAVGDLSFSRGDVLLLRPGALPAQAYWLASLHGRRGYVPRYLLDPSWRARGRLAVRVIRSRFLEFRCRATETQPITPVGSLSSKPMQLTPVSSPSSLPESSIEQQCAAALGIDLRVDPDRIFLARAALACKPAWPAPATATRYASLAATIGGTPWAATADLSDQAEVLSNGWYRASAVSRFEAAEGELSLEEGEVVLVDGETAPAVGWALAVRPADPSQAGLVPVSYLAVHDATVTAACDFEGTGAPGDLPFRCGDRLTIRPAVLPAGGFWMAKLGTQRGYVPRYLLDESWVPKGRYAAGLICRAWRAHVASINEARQGEGHTLPLSYEPINSPAQLRSPSSPLEALSFLVATGTATTTPSYRGPEPAPAPADGEVPPGYARAWAVVDFQPEHPLEMAVWAGEALLVDMGLPMPEGWVSAVRLGQWDAPGMVPISYLEIEVTSTAGGAAGEIGVECAPALGIDLAANPDLEWVVHRALCARPPWPAPQTTATYSVLAAAALAPGWPSAARPASPPKRDGSYVATTIAAFVSQDPMELAFGAGEVLWASGDVRAPEGWVLAARLRAPKAAGLAPRAYLRPHFATVIAPIDYGGVEVGDVAFAKGDVLHVRPGALVAPAYWLGSNTGRRGYVARYLIDPAATLIAGRAVSCIQVCWRRSRTSAPTPLSTISATLIAPAAADGEDATLQLRRREAELALREARVGARELQQDLREKEAELEARETAIAARESAMLSKSAIALREGAVLRASAIEERESAVSSASVGEAAIAERESVTLSASAGLGSNTPSHEAPRDEETTQSAPLLAAPPAPTSEPPVPPRSERDPDPDPLLPPPVMPDDGMLLLHRRAPAMPSKDASSASAGHRRAPDPLSAQQERQSVERRATVRAAAEALMRQAWQAAADQSAGPSAYLGEALAHLQAALGRLRFPYDEVGALECLDCARQAMAYEAAHRLASSALPSPAPLPPPALPLPPITQSEGPTPRSHATHPPMDAHLALPPVEPSSASSLSHSALRPNATEASVASPATPASANASVDHNGRALSSWTEPAWLPPSPALTLPTSVAASAALALSASVYPSAADSAASWQTQSLLQLRASVDQLAMAAQALHSTTTLHALRRSTTLQPLARTSSSLRTPKRRSASRPKLRPASRLKSRPASRPKARPSAAAGHSSSARLLTREPHALPASAARLDRSDSAPSRRLKPVSRAKPQPQAALRPPAADAWPDTKWSKTVLAYMSPKATEWRVSEPRRHVARLRADAEWPPMYTPTWRPMQLPLAMLSGAAAANSAADWFQPRSSPAPPVGTLVL